MAAPAMTLPAGMARKKSVSTFIGPSSPTAISHVKFRMTRKRLTAICGIDQTGAVTSGLARSNRGYAGMETIFPGFIMPFGSMAFLIAIMTSAAPPISFTSEAILPCPMPCSPVTVPSSSIAN